MSKYYAVSEDRDLKFFNGNYEDVDTYLKLHYPNVKFSVYELEDSDFLDVSIELDKEPTKGRERLNKIKSMFELM